MITELIFRLSREAEARIIIYGNASQEAIEKLQELLTLSKDAFPTQEELRLQSGVGSDSQSVGTSEEGEANLLQ